MKKTFISMRVFNSLQAIGESRTLIGKEFTSLALARADATMRANQKGEKYYVAEIVGAEIPVYIVEIGWEPAE